MRKNELADAMAVAYRCGRAAWHPAGTVDRAITMIGGDPAAWLSDDELAAKVRLLPATWIAAFRRGWEQASAEAAASAIVNHGR